MSTILVMDDEPLSLRRLSNVLRNSTNHKIRIAVTLSDGVQAIEELGRELDLVTIDASMFEAMAVEILELIAIACPSSKMLVITPRVRDMGRCAQLRKPFLDEDFVSAVDEALQMRDGVVAALRPKPSPLSRRPRPRHANNAQGPLDKSPEVQHGQTIRKR